MGKCATISLTRWNVLGLRGRWCKHAAISLLALMLLSIGPAFPVLVRAEPETVMRILQPCEPPPPMLTWNAFVMGKPASMIIEPLFWYSRGERKFYPWLAEGYVKEETPTLVKYVVTLRRGIKWSDGKEFTSLDVLATWWCTYLLRWWHWEFLDSIEAPDDYTVIINAKKPLHIMGDVYFIGWGPGIVSYTQYGRFAPGLKVPGKIPLVGVDVEKLKTELLDYRPDKYIGTGPYEYEVFTDTEWIYRKRPGYWVTELGLYYGGAKFDKIHWFRRISDPASWPLIMAGKFDYTWTGISRDCYEAVVAVPGYYVWTIGWLHGHCLYYNSKRYPLDMMEVRQAISYAIDLDEYCSVAIEWGPKSVIPAKVPVSISPADVDYWLPKDWRAKWIDNYDYNLAKAETILKGKGFTIKEGKWYTPEGKKFTLTIHVPAGWTGWVPGAENIAVQLTKFGIDTTVIELDWGMWDDTIRKRGAFDLAIDFWTYGSYHPYDSYWRYYVDYTVGVEGLGFSPIVEVPEGVAVDIKGMVNATELVFRLVKEPDIGKQKEIVKALAYITNHYLPNRQLHEKVQASTINIMRTTGWPIGMTDFLVEAANNPGFVYGFIICSGLVGPPVVVITYVGVWATAIIPAFTGVDGKIYGPYKAGDYMYMPKEDADRLVAGELASYAPPPPPGLMEGVDATLKAATRIEAAVATLTGAVDALKRTVEALSGTVGAMSSLLYASIALNILVLIVLVAAIFLLRKR